MSDRVHPFARMSGGKCTCHPSCDVPTEQGACALSPGHAGRCVGWNSADLYSEPSVRDQQISDGSEK